MKYIVSHNRDRDQYQVALALAESGKLGKLVTDIYVPPKSTLSRFDILRKRYAEGLDGRRVSNCLTAFLVQLLLFVPRVSRRWIFSMAQRAISRKAGVAARRMKSGLLSYSDRADIAFRELNDERAAKILFMYHPHYRLIADILSADQARASVTMLPEPEQEYSQLEREAVDYQIEQADLIICASSFTKKSLVYAGVDEKKLCVVPYGVTPIQQTEAPDGSSSVRFLFVGQGRQRKGLHLLFDAWHRADLPDSDLTCVCYAMDPAIRTMEPRGVSVLPKVSNDELVQLYNKSDVFVMPSLIEGFGLVYLEALSAGCYIIGTPNTGLPDLHLPDWAAREAKAGDVKSLVDALRAAHSAVLSKRTTRDGIRALSLAFNWENFRKGVNEAIDEFEKMRGSGQ